MQEKVHSASVAAVSCYSGSEKFQARGYNANGAQVLVGLTRDSKLLAETDATNMVGKLVY